MQLDQKKKKKTTQLSENLFNFYNLRLGMQTASVYLHQHFFACFQSQIDLTSKVLLGALIVQFPSLLLRKVNLNTYINVHTQGFIYISNCVSSILPPFIILVEILMLSNLGGKKCIYLLIYIF